MVGQLPTPPWEFVLFIFDVLKINRAQRDKHDSTVSEIDSYKKSILKEQEKNESLTIMLNQRKSETKNLEKSIKCT